jgi:hypothetical protein
MKRLSGMLLAVALVAAPAVATAQGSAGHSAVSDVCHKRIHHNGRYADIDWCSWFGYFFQAMPGA